MGIDVKPFIDKLEILNQWMNMRIEYLYEREMKYQAVMWYWKTTGLLLWGNQITTISFEEYYQQKNNSLK